MAESQNRFRKISGRIDNSVEESPVHRCLSKTTARLSRSDRSRKEQYPSMARIVRLGKGKKELKEWRRGGNGTGFEVEGIFLRDLLRGMKL